MKRGMVFLVVAVASLATVWADQIVLGGGKGNVRSVNALAAEGQPENPLEWSRRDFQDATNSEVFGFYPAYTLSNISDGADGFGVFVDPYGDVTITTVDSLVNERGWPASFVVPRYLFRQGGARTNRSNAGDHGVEGTVWVKYDLDASNPDGWNLTRIKIFAWDIRDVIHKSSTTKTKSFSDTAAPYRIDVYVASTDTDPAASPEGNPEWTLVGTLSKADGTLFNVCQWDAGTGNTFGEVPAEFLDYLTNGQFWANPTSDQWYSTLSLCGYRNVRHVALVIPMGNQYGQDPDLNASSRTSSSLRYTNFTDVKVFAITHEQGDVNRDGNINDADLSAVLIVFGQCGQLDEDVNDDGCVDDADLGIVLRNFGKGC